MLKACEIDSFYRTMIAQIQPRQFGNFVSKDIHHQTLPLFDM
jgi:hypothetical protein